MGTNRGITRYIAYILQLAVLGWFSSALLLGSEMHWTACYGTYLSDQGESSFCDHSSALNYGTPGGGISGSGAIVIPDESISSGGYSGDIHGIPGLLFGNVFSHATASGSIFSAGYGAQISVDLIFLDTWTIAGVPPGTKVPVDSVLTLNSRIFDLGRADSNNQGEAFASFDPGAIGSTDLEITNSTILGYEQGLHSVNNTFVAQAGQSYSLELQLVLISASAASAGETVSHTVIAHDTSWAELLPQLPGAYVVSDTGYGYGPITDTPEPSVWSLISLGFALLVTLIYRKRRPTIS